MSAELYGLGGLDSLGLPRLPGHGDNDGRTRGLGASCRQAAQQKAKPPRHRGDFVEGCVIGTTLRWHSRFSQDRNCPWLKVRDPRKGADPSLY